MLRFFTTFLPSLLACFVLIGCGDDDDRETENPDIEPPCCDEDSALFAANKIYTAQIAGQNEPLTLTFPAPGEYKMVQAEVTETGTTSRATREGNRWTFNVTPAAGSSEEARRGVIQLDFTAPDAGAWIFTPTAGTAETGTFTLTTSANDNGTGEPNDRTSLSGKTLQITYPGGGTEKFQFIDDSQVSYENGAETGTYTWDSTNARVNVRLNNGNLFDITIPEGSNEATVVFGGPIPEAQTDTGTYSLQ